MMGIRWYLSDGLTCAQRYMTEHIKPCSNDWHPSTVYRKDSTIALDGRSFLKSKTFHWDFSIILFAVNARDDLGARWSWQTTADLVTFGSIIETFSMREFLKWSWLDRTTRENITRPWSREMSFNTSHCTHSRIPHWQVQITVFRLFQQHRIRPLPAQGTEKWHKAATQQAPDTTLHHLVERKSFTIWRRPRRTCGPEWQPQRWGRVGRSWPPAWPTTLRPESPACWNRCRDL